jgi:hypothetical protein
MSVSLAERIAEAGIDENVAGAVGCWSVVMQSCSHSHCCSFSEDGEAPARRLSGLINRE